MKTSIGCPVVDPRIAYRHEANEAFQCATHIRPIVIAALNTGMRKGEILGLRWRDVDLADRRIVVVNSKNNETRMIPVNQTLFWALDDLRKGNKDAN